MISPTPKRNSRLKLPRFKSESDEAKWWFENQDYIGERMKKHGRKAPARQVEPSKLITIRFYETDLARARAIARKKGIRYQTYLRMVLHLALEREAS